MGGLARRSELLKQLKQEAPTLVVVGANEFLPDIVAIPARQALPKTFPETGVEAFSSALGLEKGGGLGAKGANPAKGTNPVARSRVEGSNGVEKYPAPEVIYQIYEQMPVDLVYISSQASAWLKPNPHSKFISAPATKRLEISGFKLDIVFLSTQDVAFTAFKDKPDLVLGISPWGFEVEHAERSSLPVHILLGAGQGAPLHADISVPSVLWSRSDLNGRSVLVLDIYSLPQATGWQQQDFCMQELELTEDLPEDISIKQLLENSIR